MTEPAIESTTQKFLDIHDITEDILLLKDGSASLITTVNALNFGLLAEPEQDAIMYAYAGLLNSLNYPIQIVIRSQTKDVTSYLNLLKDEEDKTADQTKKNWIARYRGFVSELIKERNVLDKKFYVVISASSLEMGLLPPSSVLPGQNKVDLSSVERSVILEKAKEILEPRRDHLLGQLGRIGLYGHQLATQEIIQLFYLSYNPEAAEGQQITDTQSYTTPMVQASVQGGFMDNQILNPVMTTPVATPAVMPVATPEVTPAVEPSMPTETATMPAATMPMDTINPVATMPIAPATQPVVATPSPIPSIQQPTMATSNSTSPTVEPSLATPAISTTPVLPATPDLAIQNEIDSTLQQIGNLAETTPIMPATPITPGVMPMATPSPVMVPPTAATPATMAPLASDTGVVADAMPPLPEI